MSEITDAPYTLSVVDVLALRESCKGLRNLGGGVNLGVPYILYVPADDAFCLCAGGSPQAKHADPRVLAELLRNERAEPGFIRRVLSATEPPDAAALNPSLYIAERTRRHAEARRQSDAAYEAHAAAQRRAAALDVSKLTLDDL